MSCYLLVALSHHASIAPFLPPMPPTPPLPPGVPCPGSMSADRFESEAARNLPDSGFVSAIVCEPFTTYKLTLFGDCRTKVIALKSASLIYVVPEQLSFTQALSSLPPAPPAPPSLGLTQPPATPPGISAPPLPPITPFEEVFYYGDSFALSPLGSSRVSTVIHDLTPSECSDATAMPITNLVDPVMRVVCPQWTIYSEDVVCGNFYKSITSGSGVCCDVCQKEAKCEAYALYVDLETGAFQCLLYDHDCSGRGARRRDTAANEEHAFVHRGYRKAQGLSPRDKTWIIIAGVFAFMILLIAGVCRVARRRRT